MIGRNRRIAKCEERILSLLRMVVQEPSVTRGAVEWQGRGNSPSSGAWEIAIKCALGSLPLPKAPLEYIPYAQRLWSIQTLNITQEHALRAGELPAHHRDPFDRMIIAQALSERMTLLTADRVLQKYKVDLIFCGK
jgi:PIN domain nuclease of toxin-antitoxin system